MINIEALKNINPEVLNDIIRFYLPYVATPVLVGAAIATGVLVYQVIGDTIRDRKKEKPNDLEESMQRQQSIQR